RPPARWSRRPPPGRRRPTRPDPPARLGVGRAEGTPMRPSEVGARRAPVLLLACLMCLATGLALHGLGATLGTPPARFSFMSPRSRSTPARRGPWWWHGQATGAPLPWGGVGVMGGGYPRPRGTPTAPRWRRPRTRTARSVRPGPAP